MTHEKKLAKLIKAAQDALDFLDCVEIDSLKLRGTKKIRDNLKNAINQNAEGQDHD